MKTEMWHRKRIRLPGFDYSTPSTYFVTVCTKDRKPVFWEDVAADTIRQDTQLLSGIGRIAEQAVNQIPQYYPGVAVDKYAIMPDHIHAILRIETDSQGQKVSNATISTVVGQMKRWVTKRIGMSVWQKSFIDRVIRNEQEYLAIWEYIDNNPRKFLGGG